MKRIIVGISFLSIVLNFSIAQNNEIENITCLQAVDLIQKFRNDTNFIIIDLRPENMYNEEHIENSIYYDVFSENFENWVNELNKDKVYLLYCNAGHRSGIALNKMKQLGFRNLYHLYEGLQEWKRQGFITIKKNN
jgi:rhodanese-related sulfurtransferase